MSFIFLVTTDMKVLFPSIILVLSMWHSPAIGQSKYYKPGEAGYQPAPGTVQGPKTGSHTPVGSPGYQPAPGTMQGPTTSAPPVTPTRRVYRK